MSLPAIVKHDFPKNEKTFRLAGLLGIDRHKAMGHMVEFWLTVLAGPEDGILDVTEEWIAEAAGWRRDPHKFADALLTCGGPKKAGFLRKTESGYAVNDWLEHAGKKVAKRVADKERKREERQATKVTTSEKAGKPTTRRRAPATVDVLLEKVIDRWNFGKEAKRWVRPTPARRAKVAARLKDGFTEEQILEVVRKVIESEWHNGANERGWKAGGPEWVLKNTEKVEEWLNKETGGGNGPKRSEPEYTDPGYVIDKPYRPDERP